MKSDVPARTPEVGSLQVNPNKMKLGLEKINSPPPYMYPCRLSHLMYQTVGIDKPIARGFPAKIHSFVRVNNSCYSLSQQMDQVAGIRKEPVGVILVVFFSLGFEARFLR